MLGFLHSPKKRYNDFVEQTAKDYDMRIEDVAIIYSDYGATEKFYEELENFIKNRSKD